MSHNSIIDYELSDDAFDIEKKRVFDDIQGAYILTDDQFFEFGKDDVNGNPLEIIFTIDDDKYLGDFIDRMPYGIVNKKATGIGATTLELECLRNSIVVFPTKALAYTKSQKYIHSFYVGSEMGILTETITPEDILEYDNNEQIEFKKFLVVADSLPKVINSLGDENLSKYFIMFDEIDMLQSDSSYRPNLEGAFDYYLRFPPHKRCVVSATIRNFSHPALKNEVIVVIQKKNPKQRNIKLICEIRTNRTANLIIDEIKTICTNKPDDKILIAYNSVTGIRGVIEALGALEEPLNDECGILCSPQSKENAGRYFRELINAQITDRITFMTCAYYAGVDIENDYHLITVASDYHGKLSIDKMTQIHGRCRNNNGVISDTIIYGVEKEEDDESVSFQMFDYEAYENTLVDLGEMAIEIINKVNIMEKALLNRNSDKALCDFFVAMRQNIENTYMESDIRMIRRKLSEDYDVAYFNIDKLLELKQIENSCIYVYPTRMKTMLQKAGHTIELITRTPPENSSITSSLIRAQNKQKYIMHNMAKRGADKIRDLIANDNLSITTLNHIIRMNTPDKTEKKLCERFKDLYRYIPNEPLLKILIKICDEDERVYKRIQNTLKFWALDENHPFKVFINQQFPLKSRFLPKEVLTILKPIYAQFMQYTIIDESDAVFLLGNFRLIIRTTITVNKVNLGSGWVVKDILPEEIEILANLRPLHYISPESPLKNHFIH